MISLSIEDMELFVKLKQWVIVEYLKSKIVTVETLRLRDNVLLKERRIVGRTELILYGENQIDTHTDHRVVVTFHNYYD